jgi:hypothetical protein
MAARHVAGGSLRISGIVGELASEIVQLERAGWIMRIRAWC